MLSLPHTVPNAKARFPLRLYFYSVPLGEGVGHSVTGVFALSTFSLGNYYAFWGYLLWYEMGVWLIIFAYVILHTFSEWMYFVNREQYMCSTMCVCFLFADPIILNPNTPSKPGVVFQDLTSLCDSKDNYNFPDHPERLQAHCPGLLHSSQYTEYSQWMWVWSQKYVKKLFNSEINDKRK